MTSMYSFKDKYSWFHWCFNRIQPDLQHSITILLRQKLKLSYAIKILGQFPGVKLGLDTPLIVTNPMNLYAKVLSGFLVTSWMSPFYKQLPAVDTEWDHDGKMGNLPIYFNPQFFGQYGKKTLLYAICFWMIPPTLFNPWNYPSSSSPHQLCPCQGVEGLKAAPANIWPQAGKYSQQVASLLHSVYRLSQDTNEMKLYPWAETYTLYVGLTRQGFQG